MVKRGKPYPDPYLAAAALLKVSPGECAVVENAPLGITAARRAGMRCIALPTSLPARFLRHADVIARDFNDITRLIDAACFLKASKPA
jgi:beta-phosphoglucomutase-like phosphatase (HAD superfamily)